jgi:hypothetical protein
MAPLTVDTVVDKCPSWGYALLLLAAFAVAIFVSGIGLRLLSGLLDRMRRLPNQPPLRT